MKDSKTIFKILYAVIRISLIIVIILGLYKMIFAAYDFGYRIFADEPMDAGIGRTYSVAIVDGKSVKEVGEILESKGLIRNSTLFVFQEKFSEYSGLMKPGVYEFSTNMTPHEMIAIMATEPEETEEETEENGNSTSAITNEEGAAEDESAEGEGDGAEGAESAEGVEGAEGENSDGAVESTDGAAQ